MFMFLALVTAQYQKMPEAENNISLSESEYYTCTTVLRKLDRNANTALDVATYLQYNSRFERQHYGVFT